MFEGVMLNAYTLKSRKSLEPWIDEYIEKGKTIMLDNGAFCLAKDRYVPIIENDEIRVMTMEEVWEKYATDIRYEDGYEWSPVEKEIYTIGKTGKTRILYLTRQHYKGEMVRVYNACGETICSPNHIIVTPDGEKTPFEAEHLSFVRHIELPEDDGPIVLDVKGLKIDGDYFVSPTGRVRWKRVLRTDEEKKAFLKFIASYITEGWICEKNKFGNIRVSLCQKEEQYLTDILQDLRLITNVHPYLYKNKQICRLHFTDRVTFEICAQLCGVFSHNKHFPDFIFKLPKHLKMFFIEELIKGDGYYRRDGVWVYTTNSPKLLSQLTLLLASLGQNFRISYQDFETYRTCFNIYPVKNGKENIPIKREIINYDDYIYDMTTEDHTYTDAFGLILVHNSNHVLTPDELAERVRDIHPHIVVAPDDIFSPNSHEKTIEMTKKFMSMNLPDDVKICVVGQGQSIKAYEWCIRELIKLEPDYIGLGRMSMKVAQYPGTHFQQRLVALDRLQQEGILDEIKDAGIKMHSLGISNPHEFKYLNYYGFASCDSMSYIYSALYRQLPLPDEPDEKPFQFDADGRIKPKPFDTEERLKAKEKLAKEFLQLESTDEKFAFVLKLWKELQRLIARDEHIEMHVREYRGFDPDEIDYFYISRPDQRKPEDPDLDRQIKEVAESVSEKA